MCIMYLGKPPLEVGGAGVDVRPAERVLDLVDFQPSHQQGVSAKESKARNDARQDTSIRRTDEIKKKSGVILSVAVVP